MSIEVQLKIEGTKEDNIDNLISQEFEKVKSCRTIANYYLPKDKIIDDTSKLKEDCVRIRKSKFDKYEEGFKLGNSILLSEMACNVEITKERKEIKIQTDQEAIELEKYLIENGFELIYTDDKKDNIYKLDDQNIVFQIQDIKDFGLIIAYDNIKYDNLSIEDQRKKLIDDILKYNIKPISYDNINRFEQLENKENNILRLEDIIKEMKTN